MNAKCGLDQMRATLCFNQKRVTCGLNQMRAKCSLNQIWATLCHNQKRVTCGLNQMRAKYGLYQMFLLCLVFAMFCARLFICASWSPAGLSFVVSSVSLSLSHWYPGSGVVLDCIDS